MKIAVIAAFAASLAASSLLSTPTRADDPIIVQSQRATVPHWVDQVTAKLQRSLDASLRSGVAANIVPEGGLAAVSFTTGSDGRPTNLTVSRHSGDSLLDRVAYSSVRRMRNLGPAPEAMGANPRVRAYIIVAPDQMAYDEYTRTLRKEEAQRRLSQRDDAREIAIIAIPAKSA